MKNIIVSNRLPIKMSIDSEKNINFSYTSGGLSSAIRSLDMDFTWVGWSGSFVEDKNEQNIVKGYFGKKNIVPLFFDKENFDNYYNGFSNNIIWPLFHYLIDRVEYDKKYWESYKYINQKFAEGIINLYNGLKNTDNAEEIMIWVHDYHLLLLPSLLRKMNFNGKIGFFLHIPFPSSEIFRTCPYAKEILEGLSGSDILGFHTDNYCRHFITSLERILDSEVSDIGEYIYDNRKVLIKTYPIGISPESFSDKLKTEACHKKAELLNEQFNDGKIILSVDRLDYTKGLLEKLDAYEHFLSKKDCNLNTILYLVLVPSRENVEQYRELLRNIEEKISNINGKYTSFANIPPIHYLYQSLNMDELSALYSRADILFVSAKRDGMNLVSFEYCTCQAQKENKGVLLLSEFTGAADYLTGSMIINPNNREDMSDKLEKALLMSPEEKNRRMHFNNSYITKHTNTRWAKNFLDDLRGFNSRRDKDYTLFKNEINDRISNSKNIYFFLDVDGTLVDFKNNPSDIHLSGEIEKTIREMMKKDNINVNIVSGRSIESLEMIFNNIDDINLFGEHGIFYKIGNTKILSPKLKDNKSWQDAVVNRFNDFMDILPGSWIEKKKHAIAFHYREVPEEYLKNRIKNIRNSLNYLLYKHNLQVINGNKVIEILERENNKSLAIREISRMNNISRDDLLIAIGDDTTDESMFEYLKNKNSLTFKVGKNKSTAAKYYVENTTEVSKLLARFT